MTLLLLVLASLTPTHAAPLLSRPPAVVRTDSTDLKAYAGTYAFASGSPLGEYTIKVENGDLYGQADGYGYFKLVKQDKPDTFQSTSQYASVLTFARDAATKQVNGFKMAIAGQELTATRKK
jgi:hypothetical protein